MEEETFLSYKIFLEGPKATITNYEMAKLYGITIREAREYIEQDIEAGFFFTDNRHYYITNKGFVAIFETIKMRLICRQWSTTY